MRFSALSISGMHILLITDISSIILISNSLNLLITSVFLRFNWTSARFFLGRVWIWRWLVYLTCNIPRDKQVNSDQVNLRFVNDWQWWWVVQLLYHSICTFLTVIRSIVNTVCQQFSTRHVLILFGHQLLTLLKSINLSVLFMSDNQICYSHRCWEVMVLTLLSSYVLLFALLGIQCCVEIQMFYLRIP